MPRRQKRIAMEILNRPAWLVAIEDPCLQTALEEALVTRSQAVGLGAMRIRRAQDEIHSGDQTVAQVASGRYTGAVACKRAADAHRKYTHAFDFASQSASCG